MQRSFSAQLVVCSIYKPQCAPRCLAVCTEVWVTTDNLSYKHVTNPLDKYCNFFHIENA